MHLFTKVMKIASVIERIFYFRILLPGDRQLRNSLKGTFQSSAVLSPFRTFLQQANSPSNSAELLFLRCNFRNIYIPMNQN